VTSLCQQEVFKNMLPTISIPSEWTSNAGLATCCEFIEYRQRHHGYQENDGEDGQYNRKRDFRRSFGTFCAFYQRDHAIEKRITWILSHTNHNAITQHTRPRGYRRSVSSAFSNDRGGFSCDRRFIHCGRACDDFSVSGNVISVLAKKISSVDDKKFSVVNGQLLRKGDLFVCEAGDDIAADGEIIAGAATVYITSGFQQALNRTQDVRQTNGDQP
jgi:hypothetical protein